jgi:multidrug resistance efflux pump
MKWKRHVLGGGSLAAVTFTLGFVWPFGNWWHWSETVCLPGVVEIQEVRLGSKIGGRVAQVAVVEGAIAEPDQVLVRFDVPELEAQKQQLQARLKAAEADLDKAKNGPRPEEKEAGRAAVAAARERLKRLEAGPRAEEIQQGRADVESAKADLKLAKEKWERTELLYRKTALPAEEFEAARANRERLQGALNKAQSWLDMLLAGSRPEDIAEASAQLGQAQANYDLLLVGTRPEDIAAAEARVIEVRGKLAEIEVNLQEAAVRAPERVLIEVLAVRKGDLVPPNQPILRVLRADDLWVKIYVPETQLGRLRLNQEVEVKVDAYPDRSFQGTIMQIASESEFTPRNVQSADERRHQVFGVKVRVANPQGVFKSGMAAEVSVPLATLNHE